MKKDKVYNILNELFKKSEKIRKLKPGALLKIIKTDELYWDKVNGTGVPLKKETYALLISDDSDGLYMADCTCTVLYRDKVVQIPWNYFEQGKDI